MKRKNLDTKVIKAVSLVAMVMLLIMLFYNVVINTAMLMAIPLGGFIAYMLGTVCAELGLLNIVEQMNSIEEQRESDQIW